MDNNNLNTTKNFVSKTSSLIQEKASALQTGADKYSTFKEEIKVLTNNEEKNTPLTENFVDSNEDEKKKRKLIPFSKCLIQLWGKRKVLTKQKTQKN